MGYGTLVSLVFHNLPSLYPSSFCRNDFLYFIDIHNISIIEYSGSWLILYIIINYFEGCKSMIYRYGDMVDVFYVIRYKGAPAEKRVII